MKTMYSLPSFNSYQNDAWIASILTFYFFKFLSSANEYIHPLSGWWAFELFPGFLLWWAEKLQAFLSYVLLYMWKFLSGIPRGVELLNIELRERLPRCSPKEWHQLAPHQQCLRGLRDLHPRHLHTTERSPAAKKNEHGQQATRNRGLGNVRVSERSLRGACPPLRAL